MNLKFLPYQNFFIWSFLTTVTETRILQPKLLFRNLVIYLVLRILDQRNYWSKNNTCSIEICASWLSFLSCPIKTKLWVFYTLHNNQYWLDDWELIKERKIKLGGERMQRGQVNRIFKDLTLQLGIQFIHIIWKPKCLNCDIQVSTKSYSSDLVLRIGSRRKQMTGTSV